MSWGRVLAEWEEAENFAVLRPAYPIPFGGVSQAIGWSRTRGEAAQKELIGMTAEAEVDMIVLVVDLRSRHELDGGCHRRFRDRGNVTCTPTQVVRSELSIW